MDWVDINKAISKIDMLRAEPNSMFSWDFTVYDDGVPIAEIDLAWIREAGEVVIDDVPCEMYRDGMLGEFVLEASGFTLVRADKFSVFLREFTIIYDEAEYTLKAQSPFVRTFELLQNDERIGLIEPDHIFTRKMTADLPETLPLAVRVFIIWLVIVLWKRAAQSS